MFYDRYAPDLNTATRSLLDDTIKCTLQVFLGDHLPIYQPSPPHFCTIVAVVELDGASQTLVIMTFREFQESEAHIDRPQANSYAQRRYSGVGIMFAHYHGGLHVLVLVVEVVDVVENEVTICAILTN